MKGTPEGELLFKFLMQKVVIDTRATDYHLRENLTSLETYITTVKSNIENFNQHVKLNVEGLNSGSERKNSLMANLFKSYKVSFDT